MSEKSKVSIIPLVYSTYYDIYFMGLESWHAFDSKKWGGIYNNLCELSNGDINSNNIIEPKREVTKPELRKVHTEAYLVSLKTSSNVAKIAEIYLLAPILNYFVDRYLLSKIRYQVQGSLEGAEAALKYGWAINLGGGFHHAHSSDGGGFCFYADITMVVRKIQEKKKDFKFLILDLDAHQGNGYARDFKDEKNVYIMDVYNKNIYPKDTKAKERINKKVELKSYTEDDEYLELVKKNLEASLKEFKPDFMIYNAGTDIIDGDRLGRLAITEKGVAKRDEFVFKTAKEKKIPILMLTSGGYLKTNAKTIADSIWSMFSQDIISHKGKKWFEEDSSVVRGESITTSDANNSNDNKAKCDTKSSMETSDANNSNENKAKCDTKSSMETSDANNSNENKAECDTKSSMETSDTNNSNENKAECDTKSSHDNM